MKYCVRCLQPDTRPGVSFNQDGVCGACQWEDERKRIDWKAREAQLLDIAENAKLKGGAYDCAVGVSGGKDSTFQAFYARDVLGLRTLLVNCQPMGLTDIGQKNIDNLKEHGFDVISIEPNRKILRRLMIRDFWKYLNPIKCSEYPLYASTYIIADKFKIPLIIQGENSALTLGTSGTGQDTGGSCMNIVRANTLKQDPFEEYVDDGIDVRSLFLYKVPVSELMAADIQGCWLNYYTNKWSQPGNAAFSISKGLTIYPSTTSPFELGTYRRFSQLDTTLVPCNQMFKYIKFGFGQCTDHVCYDIRENLLSREEGAAFVRLFDGQCGKYHLECMANVLGISVNDMLRHAEKFRGEMFIEQNGKYALKDPIWEQIDCANIDVFEVMNRLGM